MSNDSSQIESILCNIRHARAGDFETVRRHYGLVQQAHATHMPEVFRPMGEWDFPFVQFQWYLKGNNLMLIAEVDGRPVGSLLAALDTFGDQLHLLPSRNVTIWSVFTEPAMRRRGIARSLISATAEWADAKDADRIDLSVWPFNDEALLLYRKLGFAVARTDMAIKPSDVLAACGRGHLPRPHLPKLLVRR
jgi:ribosomal protein S18 acetylase RimI-like enzyme